MCGNDEQGQKFGSVYDPNANEWTFTGGVPGWVPK
jgi:hypothetical protein